MILSLHSRPVRPFSIRHKRGSVLFESMLARDISFAIAAIGRSGKCCVDALRPLCEQIISSGRVWLSALGQDARRWSDCAESIQLYSLRGQARWIGNVACRKAGDFECSRPYRIGSFGYPQFLPSRSRIQKKHSVLVERAAARIK